MGANVTKNRRQTNRGSSRGEIGKQTRARLKPYFAQKSMAYPPKAISLLAVKDQAILELWDTSTNQNTLIHTYDIQALSGISGPKLREGDHQVPEGIYKISALNPNSAYHLSMKINYPNEFDKQQAKQQNRTNLGGDIFIHGKALSVGCLAMGDEAIEDLFILAADIGRQNIKIIIAPTDPRKNQLMADNQPKWVEQLYKNITKAYAPYQ